VIAKILRFTYCLHINVKSAIKMCADHKFINGARKKRSLKDYECVYNSLVIIYLKKNRFLK